MLPRKELLNVIGASVRPMIADYFWIQLIHATGTASDRYEYRNIYDYADLVTDLDPRFEYAYVFSSTAVTYNLGKDTWVNTEESTALLEKGLRQFPKHVFLRTILAFNFSFYHRQPLRAARLLEETSRLPGAPRYLAQLATRLYAQSGAFDAGLELARTLAEGTSDPETRATFERRVKEIELERILQRIDDAIDAFERQSKRPPHDLKELVSSGFLAAVPEDPLGGTLYIGSDGRSYSSASAHRLEAYGGVSRKEGEASP
ncbi:MAG: hypothetical protein IRZ16_24110 [Myxococcaceae bacterium]|nr:hypothetical protein [Myxococcaceae bacterium]